MRTRTLLPIRGLQGRLQGYAVVMLHSMSQFICSAFLSANKFRKISPAIQNYVIWSSKMLFIDKRRTLQNHVFVVNAATADGLTPLGACVFKCYVE